MAQTWTLSYLLTDHLGSVVAITDESGTLISQQRYLPFGGVRTIPNSPITSTDYGYTGQRNLDADIGLMDYKARFYSPVLNRFIQPDSIVPNPMNPQAFNKYSYVVNSPINLNDPTGHAYCDFINSQNEEDCNGGLANSQKSSVIWKNKVKDKEDNDCQRDEICFDLTLQNNCNATCEHLATAIGITATMFDSSAFILNLGFAAAADIAIPFGGYLPMVGLYKIASFIPNLIGTYGGALWALQGIALGYTHVTFSAKFASDLTPKEFSYSITFSQDTAVSVINDALGWVIPEPNVAVIFSGLGVAYDFGRNPLSPSLSSDPAFIDTFMAPTYSQTINFSSMTSSSKWTLFPSP